MFNASIKHAKYLLSESSSFYLENINVSLEKGDVAFLFGDVGSGKTTLINLLTGNFIENEMSVEGYNVFLEDTTIFKNNTNIGIVYQNSENSFLFDTVKRQLGFLPNNKMDEILKKYNLHFLKDRYISELSIGQKKIISIIANFYCEAKFLLFDEPTSNLDEEYSKIFFELVEKFKSEKLIFIISHQIEVADSCNKLFIIKNNTLLQVDKILKDESYFKYGDDEVFREKKPLITFENFNFSHKNGKQVFKDLNLTIASNNIYGLIGGNGKGKSTLANVILDLCKGKKNKNTKAIKSRDLKCGIMLQDCKKQFFALSVRKELEFGLNKKKIGNFSEDLEEISLLDKQDEHPLFLSGGQQRLLLLTSLLNHDFDILILDEPFDNLSLKLIKIMQKKIWEYYMKNNATIIICEQSKKGIENLCLEYIDLEEIV